MIEINQYIEVNDLPPGPMLPSTFPELNLELKKGTNYYYKKLQQGKQKGNCPNLNNVLEAGQNGQQSCNVTINGKSEKVLIPDHSASDEIEQLDDVTKKLVKTQTEFILKEIAEQVIKSQGLIPGEFKIILENITKIDPPKFNWKEYLRRFIGGSNKTFTKKSRRKYNRRYDENPGLKIKHKSHILVAIDTSCSVKPAELKEFLHEIHHMQKTGIEITIVQADTDITHIGKYKKDDKFLVYGRGGTSFTPVLNYYNENLHKYTCLIYLTDGEASAPVPARGRMLWVLSSESNINKDLIGPQIILN